MSDKMGNSRLEPLLTHEGSELPSLKVPPPGPESRSWLVKRNHFGAPMGPPPNVRPSTIVYASAKGSNVTDVDGNRYVDLAAGFGSLLLGHQHPNILRALRLQSERLLQALGDVYPAEPSIALMARLAALYPGEAARVILAQSGADAVAAALKTAMLFTGKAGVIAFEGAYHGLGYAPLAACGLRSSYREPFTEALNPQIHWLRFPQDAQGMESTLTKAARVLKESPIGAILVEPIQGRAGCIEAPEGFFSELRSLAPPQSTLLIADEIWTGLGRTGQMLCLPAQADLICLGKGLGGGLPISACIGRAEVMDAWRRPAEVVHTSTFAGAPLACTTALATLDTLSRNRLTERAARVGREWQENLGQALPKTVQIRGRGLMLGLGLGTPKLASRLQHLLLRRGFITSTGGVERDTLILTPPLDIAEELLAAFTTEVVGALRGCGMGEKP